MKTIKTQIYSFPTCITDKANVTEGWELENITKNQEHNQTYQLTFNGEHIMYIERLYGFGWGCNAAYPIMSFENYKILKSLIGDYINIWEVIC